MKIVFFLFILVFLIFPGQIQASQNCSDRYLTLVNPIRGRDLWKEQTTKPLVDQYSFIKQHNFPATWLLQYDTLKDQELVSEIKKFDQNQELGVFLEVSQKFATDSRVVYPYNTAWFDPQAVFLSAYSQSERRLLIDQLFKEFKTKFGVYPKAVGAWWIDSYSLNYLKTKYHITSALVVADQTTTDDYGVSGQWWGVPYYPSKANILTPTSSKENKLDLVVLQWAQRDPKLALGDGPAFSNYSLQANDYIRQGLDINYFANLLDVYLSCDNPIGQITVGLETGIESVEYLDEYVNQLDYLATLPNLQAVTFSNFYQQYKTIHPDYPTHTKITKEDSEWSVTPEIRRNQRLNQGLTYNQNIGFKDNFVADKSEFLDRNLNASSFTPSIFNQYSNLIILLVFLTIGIFFKFSKEFLLGLVFAFASFGLIFKSGYQLGWEVYYGPILNPLLLFQIILSISPFLLILLFKKLKYNNQLKQNFLLFLPLSFGIDPIIHSLRFSFISGNYFLGFAKDALNFTGLIITPKPLLINLIAADLPAYQAAGLLKLDLAKISENLFLFLLIYPILHIILAFTLGFLTTKINYKLRSLIILVLSLLLLIHLNNILVSNPLAALSLN